MTPDYLVRRANPNPIDLAYCAGFFDGEGCIGCGGVSLFALRAVVVCGDFPSILLFQSTFGLRAVELGNGSISPSQRPGMRMFRWCANGNQCIEVLSLMEPYLRSKRPEAIAVLRSGVFIEKHGASFITHDQRCKREALRAELASLKRLGRQKEYPVGVLSVTKTKHKGEACTRH